MSATATLPSISAAALNQISLFTNQREESIDYARVVIAQAGYFAMIPFALVELALSSILSTAASLFYEARAIQTINNWYASSSIALVWTVYAFLFNMFTPMPTTEQQFNTEVLGISPNGRGNTAFDNIFGMSGGSLEEYFRGPPAVEPRVQALLDQYTLGPTASQYSTIKERLYRDIPESTSQERLLIANHIGDLCGDQSMRIGIQSIANNYNTDEWSKRFINMLICTKKEILRRNDPDEIAILKDRMTEAFQNCVNRKSTEMDALFFNYVAPHLMRDYGALMDAKESFIWDLDYWRGEFADKTINFYIRGNSHNAAGFNYYHGVFNRDVFHLAESPLSSLDHAHQGCANTERANDIRNTFTRCAMHPNTIYTIFKTLTRQHEINKADADKVKLKFTAEMLLAYIRANGRTGMALDEDNNFTPEIMIEFLVHVQALVPQA